MQISESRKYTALAFAAFKNHGQCLNAVLHHAMTYNLPDEVNGRSKLLSEWINKKTDEEFTALHFLSYHGNIDKIMELVD
jgi:hypothetical protein